MSPMKRVKHVRRSLAWGLVMFSDLQMKAITDRVGYGRVHEFSRDYRRQYGRSPMHDRLAERSAVTAESKRSRRSGRNGKPAAGKSAKSSTSNS